MFCPYEIGMVLFGIGSSIVLMSNQAVKMVLNGHQSNIREYIGSLLGENGPWDKSTRSSFSGERILCLWLPESLIPPGCDDDLWPELVLPITPEELTSGFLTVKWETISLACFYLQFGSKVHYSGMTYGPVLDGLHLPPIVHAHALICAALVHAARCESFASPATDSRLDRYVDPANQTLSQTVHSRLA